MGASGIVDEDACGAVLAHEDFALPAEPAALQLLCVAAASGETGSAGGAFPTRGPMQAGALAWLARLGAETAARQAGVARAEQQVTKRALLDTLRWAATLLPDKLHMTAAQAEAGSWLLQLLQTGKI